MADDGKKSRFQKKEEARRLKRKRIEDAGGVRPRKKQLGNDGTGSRHKSRDASSSRRNHRRDVGTTTSRHNSKGQHNGRNLHRFGRVMETVPCPGSPRSCTLSIAVPGSVVANAQTRELRTHLVGQIARAAAVFHVDEIVVFDDKLASDMKAGGFRGRVRDNKRGWKPRAEGNNEEELERRHQGDGSTRSVPHEFMARVLQYCECPQYLKTHFFPIHRDLQFAGLIPPLDAPHHTRAWEKSKYREGVVLDKKGSGSDAGSLVDCGIRKKIEINRVLTPGIRCTVKIDPSAYDSSLPMKGCVVSPSAPREEDGTYWGYSTRLADSISAVFDESPFEGGYDLKIGTSERGNETVDDKKFSLPAFKHALIVFGGVAGIEECVDADETLAISGRDSHKLFDKWVNTCPFQGSRTIRTEEAIFISLARFRPFVAGNVDASHDVGELQQKDSVYFSDDAPSEESTDNEN